MTLRIRIRIVSLSHSMFTHFQITAGNFHAKTALMESLVAFLTNISDKNAFFRRGAGLQKFQDMLNIVFAGSNEEYKKNVERCFKVHVDIEQQKPKQTSNVRGGWIQPKAAGLTNKSAKVVSFWCFSPNFGYVFLSIFITTDFSIVPEFTACNNC